MISGILNLNKPPGWTSHDVVAWVRRQAKQRQVGHAGALDPLATGVLLICLGQATRVAEYAMASSKTYQATVRLGVVTDTYDAAGKVIAENEANVSLAEIRSALDEFVGQIEQIPPAYSALKYQGQPLYRWARRGVAVKQKPRRVIINRIEILDFHPPELRIEVECGPGTYIRSLAHDLGQRLGCGAHLAALVRTRSGNFYLAEAHTIDDVATASAAGRLHTLLYPFDVALQAFPACQLSETDAQRVSHGQALKLEGLASNYEQLRAYDPAGELVALLRYQPAVQSWQPIKVFRQHVRHR